MAPFKFGKRSSKDKKSGNQHDGPSRFLHLSGNSNNNSNSGNNNSLNIFGNNDSSKEPVQPKVPPQTTVPTPPPMFKSPAQQRVFPTPIPEQQRNVSGATALPLKYERREGSAQLPPQLPREKTVWNRIRLANSPFPRYRHVASAYATEDNRVYVIGGLHDQSVYGDTWIITSENNGTHFTSQTVDINDNTPPPRVGHASTLCGNAFVVFGGDTHKVNADGLMDDDIYLFNVNSYKWTIPKPVGPRPMGRYGHKISIIATSQMKTKLYLFGGQFDETYFNDLAVFDLSSFRRPDAHWEFLKPKTFIPPPLTNHTMVSWGHKLWVFGGDTQQGLVNQVFMYDPVVNDWAIIEPRNIGGELKDIPPAMQEHAAIVYKDLMVVVGGKNEQDIYLNSVYFFNLKTFKWYKLPIFSLGIPQGRSGHSVSLLKNDKLLIMGGDKFDYARIDDNDLHTSDINMGKGTILYTLDISRLEEMCPGIMDEVSTPVINDNMRYDLPKAVETPVQTKSATSPAANGPASENASPITKPNSINPVQVQNNILTPYSNREHQNTPKNENTEIFPASAASASSVTETPLNKQTSATTSVQSARSPLAEAVPVVGKNVQETPNDPAVANVATPTSNITQGKRASLTSPVDKPETPKSVKSPVVPASVVSPMSTKPDVPVTEAKPDTVPQPAAPTQIESSDDDDEFMDSRDNESEQLHRLDAVELSPAVNNNVQMSPKSDIQMTTQAAAVPHDTESEKVGSLVEEVQVSEDLNEQPQSAEAAVSKSPILATAHAEPETTSEYEDESASEPEKPLSVPAVNKSIDDTVAAVAATAVAATTVASTSASAANTTTIDKTVLENFRSELQKLRDVAQEKSLEASGHIRDLESQIARLRVVNKKAVANSSSESINSTKLQTQCDILTADNHAMRDRILELESLLTDKFLDLENMNAVIKQQKASLERAEANNINEEEAEELRMRCKILTEENAALKAAQAESDKKLNENIGGYSSRIDTLLVKWKETTARDEGETSPYPVAGNTPHHKQVVTKLSSQLDDLLQKSQDLTQSRDKLNEEYSELESKHQGTHDTLQSTIAELASVKKTYEEALRTVDDKSEALKTSSKELDESRQRNDKLQAQIDALQQDAQKASKAETEAVAAQLKDLKAELFVISEERDSLKNETLALKKKLYTLEQ